MHVLYYSGTKCYITVELQCSAIATVSINTAVRWHVGRYVIKLSFPYILLNVVKNRSDNVTYCILEAYTKLIPPVIVVVRWGVKQCTSFS